MSELEKLLRFQVLNHRNCDEEAMVGLMGEAADEIAKRDARILLLETQLQAALRWVGEVGDQAHELVEKLPNTVL